MRFAILVSVAALAGCAGQGPKLTPDSYSPHGLFNPTTQKARAFHECRAKALDTQHKVARPSEGLAGTLAGRRAAFDVHKACMQSKGYRFNGRTS